MSWTTYYRRADVLRAVLDDIENRAVAGLPASLPTSLPAIPRVVPDHFRDALDLVGALQLRWHARLTGRLEQQLAHHLDDLPRDRDAAVRDAWADAARSLPGLRAVLDRQAVDPAADDAVRSALARANAKEQQLLAAMAGRAGRVDQRLDPRAVRIGQELQEAARARLAGGSLDVVATTSGPPRVPCGSASFVRRLRAVLAA